MTEQQPVAVLGGGSFGTAIANLLAANGQRVLQWMRDPEQAEAMRTQRENPRYLKGIKLLPGIEPVTDLPPWPLASWYSSPCRLRPCARCCSRSPTPWPASCW
jgi:hypothetical protein